jgi:hypothetical protein
MPNRLCQLASACHFITYVNMPSVMPEQPFWIGP